MRNQFLLLLFAVALASTACRGEFGYADDDGAPLKVSLDGSVEKQDAGEQTTPNNSTTGNNATAPDAGAVCADEDCGANASCQNNACTCDPGFGGDPIAGCQPGDPCADAECPFGATCDTSGECVCDSGFEPDANGGCLAITPGDTASRTSEEVCQRWLADFPMQASTLFSTDPANECDPGVIHPDALQDALRRTSVFRWLVGLPAVTSNPEQSRVTQACATTLAAENTGLTHEITESFACYSADAKTGAASSNIASGTQWPAQSVNLYVADNRVESLGHRRWVFNPGMGATGFGQRGTYSCMYSFDRSGSASPDYVAYPPPGFIPIAAMLGVWSFHSSRYTFSDTTSVEVIDVGTNAPLNVTNVYIPDGGFGQPTLAWSVAGTQPDKVYEVRITGLGGLGDSVIYRTTLASCQ